METRTFTVLALALLTAAVAGCTGSPPADAPVEPTTGGSQGPGPGASNGTAPRGNSTGNSSTPASPPVAPMPTPVHEASYTWTVQGPAAAAFTVPANVPYTSLLLNVTQEGQGVGNVELTFTDPAGTEHAVTVALSPQGGAAATANAPSAPGDWTIAFGGVGVGGVAVQVVAS